MLGAGGAGDAWDPRGILGALRWVLRGLWWMLGALGGCSGPWDGCLGPWENAWDPGGMLGALRGCSEPWGADSTPSHFPRNLQHTQGCGSRNNEREHTVNQEDIKKV